MQLITDRTEADVLLGNAKGTYGWEDLNRVEAAVEQLCSLAKQLDVHLVLATRTDWDMASLPTPAQMARYLGNVHALCGCFAPDAELPGSMEKLTWQAANAIENALQAVCRRIGSVMEVYTYSGEIYAGEENIL